MDLREIALRLAAVTVIADSAKDTKDKLRDEFAFALHTVGADAAKASLDNSEVAKVSLVSPKSAPLIFDENAFFRFVETSYSEHIQVVKQVHESFRKTFLENVVEGVDGDAVYVPTGEFLPFIMFKSREPYVSTRFAKGGRIAIVDAMRDGSINANKLIEPTPAEIEE